MSAVAVERALEPRRRKYQAEFDRLVTAARVVIRDHGTVDATVGQILSVAELSTTTFYRHFPTKDDLLLELVMQAGANTRSFLAHRMSDHVEPRDRTAAWIDGMFSLLQSKESLRANRPFLLAHPRLIERFPEQIADNIGQLIEPLAKAIRDMRGGPRKRADADARLVYHQVFGILVDRAAMGHLRDPAEVKRVVEFTLRALSPHPVR